MPERFFCHPSALVETDAIGENTRVWAFAHVMAGARIGRDCNIGDHCFVEAGASVGNEVTIKNGVSIWAHITVKDRVFLGPAVALTNDMRPRSRQPWTPVSTTIEEGATLGANATLVCGCDVGRFALVGAGAVVTRPVPDYAVVVGSPARVIGYVCECAQPLAFSRGGARCHACDKQYRKTREGVRPATAARVRASSPNARRRLRG